MCRVSRSSSSRLCAFGLVASTGGLKALSQILSLLHAPPHFALLVAQHHSGGCTPGLRRILAEAGPLPVEVAEEGVELVAGRVYLAPGDQHLRVDSEWRLRLEPAGPQELSPSGDRLLTSLAQAFGAKAGGAVLTGMGRDGALGLQALRHAGGPTYVQAPESCTVPGMPRAALSLQAAEQVLRPEELAEVLRGMA